MLEMLYQPIESEEIQALLLFYKFDAKKVKLERDEWKVNVANSRHFLYYELPHNLDSKMDREQVMQHLGQPVNISDDLETAEWFFDTHKLTINFGDDSLMDMVEVRVIDKRTFH